MSAYSSNLPDIIAVTRAATKETAGYTASVAQVIPIVLTPVLGFAFDRWGRRMFLGSSSFQHLLSEMQDADTFILPFLDPPSLLHGVDLGALFCPSWIHHRSRHGSYHPGVSGARFQRCKFHLCSRERKRDSKLIEFDAFPSLASFHLFNPSPRPQSKQSRNCIWTLEGFQLIWIYYSSVGISSLLGSGTFPADLFNASSSHFSVTVATGAIQDRTPTGVNQYDNVMYLLIALKAVDVFYGALFPTLRTRRDATADVLLLFLPSQDSSTTGST